MTNFERKLPTEGADVSNIIRGILKVQAQFAAEQKRPLGRGTHTKGICCRANFEVFDLERTLGDHGLASRLGKGIYAKPGVYPATVRFANAASTIYSDTAPDLRALSFSVELPAGMAANTAFQDYSLQTATTFPINDVHTFAVLMKVLSAGSKFQTLKAIWSLSFADFFRFLKAALIGKMQERGKLAPYQKLRYWSTVPFRNGPFDAVKYSAIPSPDNPALDLQDEPDALQDDLTRHLEEDQQMSSFEIALQLLDTEHMTHWGMRREASFWVENATAEWKESEAPFHVVGRLTLLKKSVMPAEQCEPRYIDVTEHSTPDSQPLGSVNRGRLAVESASRKVRLGEATAESIISALPHAEAPAGSRLFGFVRFVAVAVVAAVVFYFFAGFVYAKVSARNIPQYEPVSEVRYLNQGWGFERESPARETYYYSAQGAGMHGIRYKWFVNLERPFQSTRLADPDYMRSLNFIVDPVPTRANPDQLPIGFARRYDDGVRDEVVDLTCALCHTGQLNYTSGGVTKAIRIDGGSALHALTDVTAGSFQVETLLSVTDTLLNPLKFRRFSARVLGPDANTVSAKWTLWNNLRGVLGDLLKVARGSSASSHYPVQEGYGRTDALGRIGNVVFGDHISPSNYHEGNAPVSFPYLWNIWKFNWVQYGASVSQPMARNVGEAMGVGADFDFFDDYGRPVAPSERYRTSISFDQLVKLEATLQKLTPPAWPEDILPPIDHQKADKGHILFEEHCQPCHGPHVASPELTKAYSPGRTAADPMWDIRWVATQQVGTDPTAAVNFYKNTVDLTKTGISYQEVKRLLKNQDEQQKTRQATLIPQLIAQLKAQVPGQYSTPNALIAASWQEIKKRQAAHGDASKLDELTEELQETLDYTMTDESIAQDLDSIDLRAVNAGRALNIVGLIIRERYYTDNHFSDQAQQCFAGFDTLDLPQVVMGYKPRPLGGVWATPPYLHNGSVPSIYELLGPYEKRTTRFFVGRREYDPKHVGFVLEPVQGSSSGFWMDTSKPGNSNSGHLFRADYKPYDPSKPESEQYQNGVIGPALSEDDRMNIIEYLKTLTDDTVPSDRKPVDCLALLK